MGFLDDESISGTTEIPMYGKYWVKVRNCLSRAQTEVAERLLATGTLTKLGDGDVRPERSIETSAYRTYMVAASIVDWNLDDSGGRIWELNNDAAIMRGVKRLPEKYFQKIFVVVDELNSKRDDAEVAQFPDQGGDGDPQRDAGAAGADEVRAGAGSVAGVWTEPGAVPAAPLA